MSKQIQLTQSKFATVSDHRFEHFNQWRWHAHFDDGNWYARRNEGKKTITMHRQIMGVTDPKIQVDHRDGDGLNNVDENLRECTNTQNQCNRAANKNNVSGFKGVRTSVAKRRFAASITVNRKVIHLGYFNSPEEAAHTYDKAAKEYFGEFAWTNF